MRSAPDASTAGRPLPHQATRSLGWSPTDTYPVQLMKGPKSMAHPTWPPRPTTSTTSTAVASASVTSQTFSRRFKAPRTTSGVLSSGGCSRHHANHTENRTQRRLVTPSTKQPSRDILQSWRGQGNAHLVLLASSTSHGHAARRRSPADAITGRRDDHLMCAGPRTSVSPTRTRQPFTPGRPNDHGARDVVLRLTSVEPPVPRRWLTLASVPRMIITGPPSWSYRWNRSCRPPLSLDRPFAEDSNSRRWGGISGVEQELAHSPVSLNSVGTFPVPSMGRGSRISCL